MEVAFGKCLQDCPLGSLAGCLLDRNRGTWQVLPYWEPEAPRT